jgi:hypothetical protein
MSRHHGSLKASLESFHVKLSVFYKASHALFLVFIWIRGEHHHLTVLGWPLKEFSSHNL